VFAALLCVQSLGFNIQSTIKPRHTSCVQQPTVLGMSTTTVSRTSPLFLADVVEIPEKQDEDKKLSLVAKLKRWYFGSDRLTFRCLAKMGILTYFTFEYVNKFSHATLASIACFMFSKRVSVIERHFGCIISSFCCCLCLNTRDLLLYVQSGMSPLAPGQREAFLTMYKGFSESIYGFLPMQVVLAFALAPNLEPVLSFIKKKDWRSTLFIASLLLGVDTMVIKVYQRLGIVLASLAAGVPIFPAK